jgi:hypothetical protein
MEVERLLTSSALESAVDAIAKRLLVDGGEQSITISGNQVDSSERHRFSNWSFVKERIEKIDRVARSNSRHVVLDTSGQLAKPSDTILSCKAEWNVFGNHVRFSLDRINGTIGIYRNLIGKLILQIPLSVRINPVNPDHPVNLSK